MSRAQGFTGFLWIQPPVTVSNRGLFKLLNSTSSEHTHCDLALEYLQQKKKKSFFTTSSGQVSFHCDTKGPIEIESYLRCSVACVSLRSTKSTHCLE